MDTGTKPAVDLSLYDRDFHAWCLEQGAHLRRGERRGANDGLDYENLAEEIESLGRAEKNALRSHLVILVLHLLKWRHQPQRRGSSWETSIFTARREIEFALEDSPSLRGQLAQAIERAYPIAVRKAEAQTRVARDAFPPACPFSLDQLLDLEFLPHDLDDHASRDPA